jgi:hypothetical protein
MFDHPRRTILSFAFLLLTVSSSALGSQAEGFKDFNHFKGVVPGVDFFASNRAAVTPFEKPVAETRQRLADLLGRDLPPGAVFVCSTLAQKDAVYEPRALKMGFKWILSVLTPEARADEMMQRIKAQMAQTGGDTSQMAERLERMRSRNAQMRPMLEAGLARQATRQMAFALLQATLSPETEFRLSRVDDAGRSPLPDWLDVGIASYASAAGGNTGFLQQHLEEIFPLEDMLTMSRPFLAPGSEGGGGQMIFRTERSGGASGSPAGGDQGGPPGAAQSGARTGGPRTLPKDQLDRMMFDGQAASFFTYLIEKAGLDKVKEVVNVALQDEDPIPTIKALPTIGTDLDKVEEEWTGWVKTQKPEPDEFRMRMGGSERPQR